MNKYIKGACLAAFLSVSGAHATTLERYTEPSTSVDTGRVSQKDFIAANPEFANVNFSAIGSFTYENRITGKIDICSAVLLEPGNIIATAQHCINMDNPGRTYTFTTHDASGKKHTISVPLSGKRDFQHLHIPKLSYFDPSRKTTDTKQFYFQTDHNSPFGDIAFITLTKPLPKGVEPARIAPANTSGIREVFIAGYSANVGHRNSRFYSKLTISKDPCYQTLDIKNQKRRAISTCYASVGDSGGPEFIINNGKIEITSIANRVVGLISKKEKKGATVKTFKGTVADILSDNKMNSTPAENQTENTPNQTENAPDQTKPPSYQTKSPPTRLTYSAPLAPLRDFCLKDIGAKYCTGFPESNKPPENTPVG